MKTTANARVTIIGAALAEARTRGLADLTVADVAKAAGVSSALVHYHFDTKTALLVAVGERAGVEDAETVAAACAHGAGLATLDRLWEVLAARVASGSARLRAELLLRAAGQPDVAAALTRSAAIVRDAIARRLPGLMTELGGTLTAPPEELAGGIAALFDGLALTLAAGAPAADVRSAYDAFWLTLLSAGQGGRRR